MNPKTLVCSITLWAALMATVGLEAHAQRRPNVRSTAMTETSATVLLPVPYIEQPDGSTCLPTSLNMVLHYLGRADLTTQTIFALHRRTQYDRYNLPAIVADYGLHAFPSWLEHAWTPETIQAELRAGRPVILGVDVSRAGHFVVAVGYTADGKVIIHDPDWKANGFFAGGRNIVTTWDRLVWRNGIMVRTEPFPEPKRRISATIDETTAPRTLLSGQTTEALISIRNNGRDPWPADTVLRPVDAYTKDWSAGERTSLLGVTEIRPVHTTATASETPVIHPGEVALFRLPLTAPQVDRTTTVRENFNLYSPSDGWFSQDWMTGPSNREIFLRLAIHPAHDSHTPTSTPMPGTFHIQSPIQGWQVKNSVTAQMFEPPPADLPPVPETTWTLARNPGSTTPLALYTAPEKGHTVAFVGDPQGRNTSVAAWIWCDYRPEGNRRRQSPDPDVTRVGLFARDSGQHQYGRKSELESGDALTMTYDSDDGRLRVGTIARGGFDDWRPRSRATFLKQSGWNHFRIDCRETSVTYFLNGMEIHTEDLSSGDAVEVRDYKLGPLFQAGDSGVFIETLFVPTGVKSPRRGVFFADFHYIEHRP